MAELRRCLARAATGRGLLVLLAGEAGIGKTRIADELATHARTAGVEVLWGRCHEGDGAPAYWPWIQVIRACLAASDGSAGDPEVLHRALVAGADDVAQLVPEIRSRFPGLAPPPSMEPAQARFRLFDSVARFLSHVARSRPIVVILDDLHRSDASSLLLLQFLAREVEHAPILVLGTYRDGEVGPGHPLLPALGAVVREPATRRLVLPGLGARDVARYIESTSGIAPPAALTSAITERTEGNPFFVGEMVRLLVAEGGAGSLAIDRAAPPAVPQGVHEVVGQHLERLSAGCRDLLRQAAVVGREFGLDVLEPVSGFDRDRVLEALEEAIMEQLVVEVPGTLGRFRFVHALVRDALYASLAMTRRLRLHRAVGEVLEQLQGADPTPHLAELTHHFGSPAPAGTVEKAVAYARRAGEQATARLAFEEAVQHYQGALDALALRGPRGERERCEVHLALADAHYRTGDAALARQASECAATIARALRAPELLARAPLASGSWWGVSTPSADLAMVDLLDEALGVMPPGAPPLRAAGLARLAAGLHWGRALERAVAVSEDAVAMARRLGDAALLARCLNARHYVLQAPDRLAERLAVANEMLRVADAAGDLEMVAAARRWRTVDLLELGDIAAVDREVQECALLAGRMRQPALVWYADTFRALRSFMAGHFAEGEEIVRAAAALGERAVGPGAVEASRAQLGLALWQQGRYQEMAATLTVPRERMPVYRCSSIVAGLTLGDVAARHEYEALARDDFASLPIDADWLPSICMLAVASWAFRDAARAAILYRLLLPYADRNVVLGIGAWTCTGCAAGQLGLLAKTMQRWDDAARHFEDAIAANRRMGMRPWVAQYQFEYARALLSRDAPGDRERAVALLCEAEDSATELDLRELAGETAALRQETAGMHGEPGAPTTLTRASLLRHGDYWTVEHDGAVCRLKDAKGLGYLARLLAEPGREFHVLDLVTTAAGAPESAAGVPPSGPGPALDARAKVAYR